MSDRLTFHEMAARCWPPDGDRLKVNAIAYLPAGWTMRAITKEEMIPWPETPLHSIVIDTEQLR